MFQKIKMFTDMIILLIPTYEREELVLSSLERFSIECRKPKPK